MTTEILKERQAWTLAQKVDHALATIDVFISRMGGVDKVYCSFSGGKDSTVLLHLCRILYPDILAVFCSTGNEYPEIIQFVKKQRLLDANIQIIHPDITPRQVWAKYGFPLIGKETAQKIHKVRFNPETKTASIIMGTGFFCLAQKWRYLLTEPYETSSQCCDILKKRPFHKFEKITGRRPIIGVMADESDLRKGQYIKAGGVQCVRRESRITAVVNMDGGRRVAVYRGTAAGYCRDIPQRRKTNRLHGLRLRRAVP